MLRKYIFTLILSFGAICHAYSGINPIRIDMNDAQYLFLKFPTEIKYADMGSADLSAGKVLQKILKIKANHPFFEKTNLSVVTTDGKYYSFSVQYNATPSYIAIKMDNVKDSITASDLIPATHIEVSDINTTHIILPTKVADIALGHPEIISEKAEGIDNIVKLKSVVGETEKFQQTSITVVSEKGDVYPMVVDYAQNPTNMSILFTEDGNALFRGVNVNDESMREMAEWIVSKGQEINDLGVTGNKMLFQLSSVYTDQDIIAFYLHAINSSKIDYAIDFVKAYIKDIKKSRNTVVQEDEQFPIYAYYSQEDKVIHGKEDIDIVLFFKKFTLPKTRMLYFEMFEENGGRHLKFTAPNKTIINAEVMQKLD